MVGVARAREHLARECEVFAVSRQRGENRANQPAPAVAIQVALQCVIGAGMSARRNLYEPCSTDLGVLRLAESERLVKLPKPGA